MRPNKIIHLQCAPTFHGVNLVLGVLGPTQTNYENHKFAKNFGATQYWPMLWLGAELGIFVWETKLQL